MENKKDNNNEAFHYIYSAKEREELLALRTKYLPKEESKIDRLRRMDASVSKKATLWSLVLGIVGALVMGLGMSLAMTSLGEVFGLQNVVAMTVGILVGVLGMVAAALAYPLYSCLVKKERERIAPEILRLTDELMK